MTVMEPSGVSVEDLQYRVLKIILSHIVARVGA